MSRVLLNVAIPGDPVAQERARWGKGRVYDPNTRDKDNFLWQLRSAVPRLKPELTARIGVEIRVHTASWREDADNYLKFYMDALSPARAKKKLPKLLRQQLTEQSFAVWANDSQVDDVHVKVTRGAPEPHVELLIYTLS